MKKTIATLLIMCIAFGTYAYNEDDLQNLIQEKSCMCGDLREANLKGAVFKDTVMPDGLKYTGSGEDYHGPLAPTRQ